MTAVRIMSVRHVFTTKRARSVVLLSTGHGNARTATDPAESLSYATARDDYAATTRSRPERLAR